MGLCFAARLASLEGTPLAARPPQRGGSIKLQLSPEKNCYVTGHINTDLWWKCRWRVPVRWCGRGSSPWGTEPSRVDVRLAARPLWWGSWNPPLSGPCRWWKLLWRQQRRRCWWRNTIWRTWASAAIPTSPVNTRRKMIIGWESDILVLYLGIKKILVCEIVWPRWQQNVWVYYNKVLYKG